MADQKECFIIMPITTPDLMIEKYRDGADHFKHVLDCLFIPAIKKAGYVPKPPIAKGSDLIHAEIINNIETADIVLCDMSCLNPNVFFEFGIRTSLNKPVSVVKDELTKTVPFDTGIINYQEYKSSIDPWHLENEINKLSDHINASYKRSKGENTLWKYFGLKSEAAHYKAEAGSDGKLDYLALQLDSLREKIDELTPDYKKINSSIGKANYICKTNLGNPLFTNLWNAVIDYIDNEDHLLACKLAEAEVIDVDEKTKTLLIGFRGGMSVLAGSIADKYSSIEAVLKKLTGKNLKLSIMPLPKSNL